MIFIKGQKQKLFTSIIWWTEPFWLSDGSVQDSRPATPEGARGKAPQPTKS
jgi:hypothetical protein